jgi:RNA polymerase sigma factor (sigma-70 family)
MEKDKYTDQEIIQGIVSQNTSVLIYIYKKYFKSVKNHIEVNSGSYKDAEDIFQDVLILIFNKIRRNDFNLTCSFATYLFAIAKTQWLIILRHRKKVHIPLDEFADYFSCETEIEEKLVQAEKENLIIRYLNEISDDCKIIIEHLLNGRNLDEITKLMGYSSVQHTKNRRLKCKKFLINKIISNPRFKELANGKIGENYQIPRW